MNKHRSGETVRAEHLKIVLGLGSVWMASGTGSGCGAMGKITTAERVCTWSSLSSIYVVGRKMGFRFPRLLGHTCKLEHGSTQIYQFSVS